MTPKSRNFKEEREKQAQNPQGMHRHKTFNSFEEAQQEIHMLKKRNQKKFDIRVLSLTNLGKSGKVILKYLLIPKKEEALKRHFTIRNLHEMAKDVDETELLDEDLELFV